ncbi:MAG TPA: DUF58 domain-containing protein [Candidatus Nanoarchaeia archaeon]|nr:DUF58 domain-containing protein [Candidatus Nanoarchaeia archaeon]
MKEIKVDFRPMIKRLEATSRRGLFGENTGEYRSVFKGRGFEFTGFRPYLTSDDAHSIDWKASIRASELLIREYAEERNLQIMFLLDVSSSMSFASVSKLKNEYAAEVIASLTYSMLEAGDQVGLVMFSDKIVRSIQPNSGPKQFYTITKALSDPKLYDGNVDFSKVLRYAGTSIKQNTILIMVSDFIGMDKDWESPLKAVAQRSELIGIMVRDPFDIVLPDVGQVVVSDPFSERELVLNTTALRFAYALETRRQIESLRKLFSEINSDIVVVTTNKPFVKTIVDFFAERKRRWR